MATARKPFSNEREDEGKASTYKARKAAKERREIEQLYKRTGIEEPFTLPETFAEAAKHVTAELRRAANAGCEIDDDGEGKHLVEVEFFDGIGEAEIEETDCISDKALRQGIREATGNKVKKGLLGSEGLLSARRMIARLMQEDVTAAEAFAFLLAKISFAVPAEDKDRWLNSWNLIARRLAGELYSSGIDNMSLTDDGGQDLPEKFRAADWNGVIAPWLFTGNHLAGLRKIIADHGAEAVDDAVSEFLNRSKVDREIERLHVRSWAYFGAIITGERERL